MRIYIFIIMYNECCLSFSVTGMSPLSPYLNVDPRYLVQVSFSMTTATFQVYLKVCVVEIIVL